MPDPINILQIHNLHKTFESGHRALAGLSLVLPRGSIFGFIGLNGAGKTTTIRCIAGLLHFDAGEIFFAEKLIEQGNSEYKREIGFVLDEPLYFDWMDAVEYLTLVGALYGVPHTDVEYRTAELLEFLDLTEKAHEPIRLYSTGMKKKISLAAAIIHRPRLVVLDEPLEGIDALAASGIKETLSLMASRGSTVFITSHVLDTVERFCTDIAIIHRGSILLQSKTDQIHERAQRLVKSEGIQSLEDLFVELVSDKVKRKPLSYV
jgi:ABC-2 type transport system ATP-binding protein